MAAAFHRPQALDALAEFVDVLGRFYEAKRPLTGGCTAWLPSTRTSSRWSGRGSPAARRRDPPAPAEQGTRPGEGTGLLPPVAPSRHDAPVLEEQHLHAGALAHPLAQPAIAARLDPLLVARVQLPCRGAAQQGLDLCQGHPRPDAAHVILGQPRPPEQPVGQQQGAGDQRQPGQPQQRAPSHGEIGGQKFFDIMVTLSARSCPTEPPITPILLRI
jgi:hypothetical protein